MTEKAQRHVNRGGATGYGGEGSGADASNPGEREREERERERERWREGPVSHTLIIVANFLQLGLDHAENKFRIGQPKINGPKT
jgi:hypothetical protein